MTRGRFAPGIGTGVRVSITGAAGAVLGSALTAVATLPPGATVTTRQWTRDGVDIASATSSTYTLVSGDIGKLIGCRVTATVPTTGSVTVTAPVVTMPGGTLYLGALPLQINGAYLRLT